MFTYVVFLFCYYVSVSDPCLAGDLFTDFYLFIFFISLVIVGLLVEIQYGI